MKNTIIYIVGIVLSFGLCSSSCNNESKNKELGIFISEESIFNELAKEYQGLTKDDICIDEIKEFKTLFIVGLFAHDRGCGNFEYFYNGHTIELSHENIQTILLDNEFKKNKLSVVESYNEKVVCHLQHVLKTAPELFDTVNYEFHAPKVWQEGDQIISSIWIKKSGGMIPEDNFYQSVLIIDTEGMKISHSKKNQYSVPYN